VSPSGADEAVRAAQIHGAGSAGSTGSQFAWERRRRHETTLPLNLRLLLRHTRQAHPIEILWDEVREKYFHNRLFNYQRITV
jgi:hypothetical protein